MKKNLRVPYGLSVHGKEEINSVIKVLKHQLRWVKMFMSLKKLLNFLIKNMV